MMAIRSNAFGRVTLTERDAEKFENQVKFGKPKPAAIENVKRGVSLSNELAANGGKIRVSLKRDRLK